MNPVNAVAAAAQAQGPVPPPPAAAGVVPVATAASLLRNAMNAGGLHGGLLYPHAMRIQCTLFRGPTTIVFGPRNGGTKLTVAGPDPANPALNPGLHMIQVDVFLPPGDARIGGWPAAFQAAAALGQPVILHAPAGTLQARRPVLSGPSNMEVCLENPHGTYQNPSVPAGLDLLPAAAAAAYMVAQPPLW